MLAAGRIGNRSCFWIGVDVDSGFQKLVNQTALVAENPGRWRWLAMDVTNRHGFLRLGGLVEFREGIDSGRWNRWVRRHEMQVTLDLSSVMFGRNRPHAVRR